jgi:hypothetical protein
VIESLSTVSHGYHLPPVRERLILPPVKDLFGLVQVDIGLAVPEAPVALQSTDAD